DGSIWCMLKEIPFIANVNTATIQIGSCYHYCDGVINGHSRRYITVIGDSYMHIYIRCSAMRRRPRMGYRRYSATFGLKQNSLSLTKTLPGYSFVRQETWSSI